MQQRDIHYCISCINYANWWY